MKKKAIRNSNQENNKRHCQVRKEGKPPVVKEKVVESSKRSKSTTSARKRTLANVIQPKEIVNIRKKTKTGKMPSGCGVFISENTGWTCEQRGRPDLNRVITAGKGTIITDSNVVTGDLGFKPKTTKWKGKEVVTQDALFTRRTRKQMATKQQSQGNATQITEAQRQRAAASRELAEKRLAERRKMNIGCSQPTQRVTRSTQAKMSGSQPNPTPLWKI